MNAAVANPRQNKIDSATTAQPHANLAAKFDEYVRTNRQRMIAVAQRILRNPIDAEDAVQDAMQMAWRGLSTFDERSKLGTWLHRIVVNAALMLVRSNRRSGRIALDSQMGDHAANRVAADRTAESAHSLCEAADDAARVIEVLATLPDDARRVIQLRLIDQVDTQQTARLLRLSPSIIKVRLFRAIRMVRQRLAA